MDLSVQGAVDLPKITVPAARVSGSQVLVKEACSHSSRLSYQAACPYCALKGESRKTKNVVDLLEFTYPKCTLRITQTGTGITVIIIKQAREDRITARINKCYLDNILQRNNIR